MKRQRSHKLDNIRGTLEKVFIELGDSLPRLLSYELSAPYDDLNRSVLKYYTDMLELFMETDRYINESSKSKHILIYLQHKNDDLDFNTEIHPYRTTGPFHHF